MSAIVECPEPDAQVWGRAWLLGLLLAAGVAGCAAPGLGDRPDPAAAPRRPRAAPGVRSLGLEQLVRTGSDLGPATLAYPPPPAAGEVRAVRHRRRR